MSFPGIVTTDADVDTFRIEAGAGPSSFAVTPAPNSPNLDARLKLLDGAGTVLASDDPSVSPLFFDQASGMAASLGVSIPSPGTYYLVVEGVGALNPATTGYSGYGSIGRYTLAGTFTPGGPDTAQPSVSGVSPLDAVTGVGADASVAVTFSEAMNESSVEGVFSLKKAGSGTVVDGSFSWSGDSTVVTFDPAAALDFGSAYDVAVGTAATDTAGNALGSEFASSFMTSDPVPPDEPAVTGVLPADDATQVAANENVVVTFSEAMNQSSVASAFSLKKAGSSTKLGGSYSWNAAGTELTFNPSANLLANTHYDVAVTTAAKDVPGKPLGSAFGSSFETDSAAPTVSGVSPADSATDVAGGENVVITFSEAMNQSATKTAFSLKKAGSSTKLGGSYSWNVAGTELTFNPSANLLANTHYDVAITTAAKDLAGNPLGSAFGSSFEADSTAPSVAGVLPVDGVTQVAANENVVVTFSESMNQSSVASAFSLKKAGSSTKLSGSYSWNAAGTELTFDPSADLLANTVYRVAVTTAAKDLAGNRTGSAFGSSFETDSTAPSVTAAGPSAQVLSGVLSVALIAQKRY